MDCCDIAVDLLPAHPVGHCGQRDRHGIPWQDAAILAVMGVITLVLAASRVRKSLACEIKPLTPLLYTMVGLTEQFPNFYLRRRN